MFTLSLATASAKPVTKGAISAESAANLPETGDDFAMLLGLQAASAVDEVKTGPAAAHFQLPKSGRVLPDTPEATPEVAAADAPDEAATDLPKSPPAADLLALPIGLAAPVLPTATPAAALNPIRTIPLLVEPGVEAPPPATRSQLPTSDVTSPAKPNGETAETPARARPDAKLPFALPAQASARAVLVHEARLAETPKPALVLPEQAAAQATFALTSRGNPSRPGRLPETVAALTLPSDAETPSALPLAPLRPLRKVLSARAITAEIQSPLATTPARDQPQSAQQIAVPPSSATPAPVRHDFAAMIDRLFEAREIAGAQPVAMTLRHDDFGAVSLNFHSSDDGLTVTMASADPDFARAANAAGAPAGASSQSDLARQGSEPSPPRQSGSSASSDGTADQSRAGSRDAERDGSRPRREPASPQRSVPRRQDSSGIFA